MTKFYAAICKNGIYVFSAERKPVHIDGEKFFEYESNKLREATRRLADKLVDENNLDGRDELKFFVIENSDALRNENFSKELGGLIAKKYSVSELLRKTISELKKNPKLYVDELGINYDGECYRTEKELLTKSDFSLLALSIEPAELLKYVD